MFLKLCHSRFVIYSTLICVNWSKIFLKTFKIDSYLHGCRHPEIREKLHEETESLENKNLFSRFQESYYTFPSFQQKQSKLIEKMLLFKRNHRRCDFLCSLKKIQFTLLFKLQLSVLQIFHCRWKVKIKIWLFDWPMRMQVETRLTNFAAGPCQTKTESKKK